MKVAAILLLVIVSSDMSVSFDPCTDVQPRIIDDVFRSTGYEVPPGGQYKCDLHLQEGWYKFESEAGNEMPTSLVDIYHCGTYRPIWMLGPHPAEADGVVEVEVCGNPLTECLGDLSFIFKWKIKVRNCGSYYLYYLKPTKTCNLAYCAGSETVCPRGYRSSTGSQIGVNCLAAPPGIPTPTIRATTGFDKGENDLYVSNVALHCEFDFPAWDNVTFEVQWQVDGVEVKVETMDTVRVSTLKQRQNPQDDNTFVAGSRAQCKLRSRYNVYQGHVWGPYYDSEAFYAGLEVEPKLIVAAENDDDGTIYLTSNIPIKCPDEKGRPIDCSLTVYLDEGEKNNGAIAASDCSFTLNNNNDFIDSLQIRSVRDFTDAYLHDVEVAFGIAIPSDMDHLNFTKFFWSDYRSQSIPVKVSRANVDSGSCQSVTDPHIYTFDSKSYSLLGVPGPGDYVLVKNSDKHFEVQTRVWPCHNVLCNCGVVVRDRNDIIKIDMCNGRPGQTAEDVVQLSHGCLSKRFKITRSGNTYEIWVPSGREITVDVNPTWMEVNVHAIPDDNCKTQGLCGNFNGDQSDEFEGLTEEEFKEKYRLTSSLFDTLPGPLTEEKDVCICQDSNDVNRPGRYIDCDVAHNHKMRGGRVSPLRARRYCPMKRRRRDESAVQEALDDEDDDDLNDNVEYTFGTFDDFKPRTPSWPTPSGITQSQAEEHCKKLIKDTPAGKTCAENVGIDLDEVIENCVLDIQFTDDPDSAQSSVNTVLEECTFQAYKNVSLYEKSENGTLVPPVKILNVLCPGDCNFHGNCSNGTCICEKDYVGEDCSQPLKESPQLFHLAKDGLCDVRKYGCRITRATGKGFVEKQRITCFIREMKYSSGSWTNQTSTSELQGEMEGRRKVKCPLPTHRVIPVIMKNKRRVRREVDMNQPGTPVTGYVVSVSSGNSAASNELRVTIFDSVCMDCDSQGNCKPKANSCQINGYCFAAGDPNPQDWNEQCLPTISRSTWRKQAGEGEGGDGGWKLIAVIVAAVTVVIVALILLVCTYIKEKGKKRPIFSAARQTVYDNDYYIPE